MAERTVPIEFNDANIRVARKFKAQRDALVSAAEHVCWFDWSNNDPDAVAAIDALRALVGRMLNP